jgi:hypothetical protein
VKTTIVREHGALKAEPMDSGHLDAWLSGRTPRRILSVPFGGPVPSPWSKAGVDVDGEWFDEATDLTGGFPALERTRDRLVDWHHDQDPTGVMKGAILGKMILDQQPSSVEVDGITALGYWGDFWANAGERRRTLVAQLERQGHALYGSSEAIAGAWKKAATGHIDVWPLIRQTVSTSPQNTFALLPALKAVLSGPEAADLSVGGLQALLLGIDVSDPDLRDLLAQGNPAGLPSVSGDAAKAGRVISSANATHLLGSRDLTARAREALAAALDELDAVLSRIIREDASMENDSSGSLDPGGAV